MGILSGNSLVDAIKDERIIIKRPNEDSRSYASIDAEGPIRQSSLDLTLAEIYIPPNVHGWRKGLMNRVSFVKSDKVKKVTTAYIPPGSAVVVRTTERITLSSHLAGLALPPSSLMKDGLIMTNPGHVDPGYSGYLSFSLLNLSARHVPLDAGSRIARLLIFVVENPTGAAKPTVPVCTGTADANYDQRCVDTAKNLAPEFLNVRESARIAAVSQVGYTMSVFGLAIPISLGAVAAMLSIFLSPTYKSSIEVSSQIQVLENRLLDSSAKIDDLSSRIGVANRTIEKLDQALKDLKSTRDASTPSEIPSATPR